MFLLGPRYLPTENSAGYLQRVQIKPFIAESFTCKKHSIHRNGVIQHEFPLSQTLNRHGSSKDNELQLPLESAHTMKDIGHTLPGHLLSCPSKLNIGKQ